jgi:hypothetical protein
VVTVDSARVETIETKKRLGLDNSGLIEGRSSIDRGMSIEHRCRVVTGQPSRLGHERFLWSISRRFQRKPRLYPEYAVNVLPWKSQIISNPVSVYVCGFYTAIRPESDAEIMDVE